MNTTKSQATPSLPTDATAYAIRILLDADPRMTTAHKTAVLKVLCAEDGNVERRISREGGWEPLAVVAERLGVSRMSLYRYANARAIPSRTEGRGVLVKESDVRAYIEQHPHHLRGPAPK